MYYTQIILLLFAEQLLVSVTAYTLVQIQDHTIKQKDPQETSTELVEPTRPFTNGHGYQYDNWELVDEQQKSRTNDKVKAENTAGDLDIDRRDNSDDIVRDDTHYDNHEDSDLAVTARPFTNGHGYEFANWDPIDVKELRNKLLDKMKEMYPSIKRHKVQPKDKVRRKRQLANYQNIPDTQYNVDPQVIPDHVNRMIVTRPSVDSSKWANGAMLRDEYGNGLYDNMNPVFSGNRYFGNVPRAGNLKSDQGYVWNQLNNLQNEAIQNQYVNQAQQRPLEGQTSNNSPYKQTIQSNKPDNDKKNMKLSPTSDIRDDRNIQKQTNYEISKIVHSENIPQVDKQTVTNNGVVNKNSITKEEMLYNVNQINSRINCIKDKVKDKLGNYNGILISPEAKKQCDKNVDIADTQVNDYIPPIPNKLNLTDELEPGEDIVNVHDTDDTRNNNTNDGDNTNVTETNEEMENPVENLCNLNHDGIESSNNNNQVPEENLPEKPEAQATETMSNDNEKETLDPETTEILNETSTMDIKQEPCLEEIEETVLETSDIKEANDANDELEENNDDQEKYDIIKEETTSADLNFDELFDKDEFWDWLSKWTTAYMDIINENIQTVVKEEVAKQLEEMHSKTTSDRDDHSITIINKLED